MKQLGIGVHNFHDTMMGLPPCLIGTGRATTFPLLYPFIEQDALYRLITDFNSASMVTNTNWWINSLNAEQRLGFGSVSYMSCPTRRGGKNTAILVDDGGNTTQDAEAALGPRGDYAIVMAVNHIPTDFPSYDTATQLGAFWTFHYSSNNAEGSVSNHRGPFRVAVVGGGASPATTDYAAWKSRDTMAWWSDGTSNQLIVGEKHVPIERFGICYVNRGASSSDLYGNNSGECSYLIGAAWAGAAPYARPVQAYLNDTGGRIHSTSPIARDPDQHGATRSYNLGFGSWHPRICQFLLGDGSIRPISVTTPINVMGPLGLVNDGLSVDMP